MLFDGGVEGLGIIWFYLLVIIGAPHHGGKLGCHIESQMANGGGDQLDEWRQLERSLRRRCSAVR